MGEARKKTAGLETKCFHLFTILFTTHFYVFPLVYHWFAPVYPLE